MIKVETELLDDHQARLIVTPDPEQVEREMQAAARRIARQVNIPGFRKGKAPYRIIKQYFGREAILEEALESLAQEAYADALEQSEVAPYAPGSLTDVSTEEPLVLTFLVPLTPVVELGAYRDVRLPFEIEEVTNVDVEAALQALQEQHATLTPVERPVAMGDIAVMDITGTLVRPESEVSAQEQPAVWLARKGVRVKIAEDATYPVRGFPAQVVGMKAGDERSFDITFDASDEEAPEAVRGKTLHFEVKCEEVYEFRLPELDDQFAQEAGDFQGILELRADVRSKLEDAARHTAREKYIDAVVDHLLESVVTIRFPPVMVEEELDDMLEDFDSALRQRGLNLAEYRRISNLTEEQMRDDMRETAERRVRRMLLLTEVVRAERLRVTDEEIDDEIRTMMLSFGPQAAVAQQVLSSPDMKRTIESRLLVQKALDRLADIARGKAPELSPEEEETAEPTAGGEMASTGAGAGITPAGDEAIPVEQIRVEPPESQAAEGGPEES